MDYTQLKKALEDTHTALDRGEILMHHRMLLSHLVEQFENMIHVDETINNDMAFSDTSYEALGSTVEIVEDEFYAN